MTTTTTTMAMIMMITSESRKGTDDNPDLQLGLLTSVFTILLLHMSIPFLSLVIAIMMLLMMILSSSYFFSDVFDLINYIIHHRHNNNPQIKAKAKLIVSILFCLNF